MRLENRAYLLQVKFEPWQVPFHLEGGERKSLSLKLSASGHTPANKTVSYYFLISLHVHGRDLGFLDLGICDF